ASRYPARCVSTQRKGRRMGILRGLVAVAAVVTWAAVPTGGAAAQAWPVRPATMIIPYGTGSGIDVLGRILAPAIAEKLGQPIVVENVGGAGGVTGAAPGGNAPPERDSVAPGE